MPQYRLYRLNDQDKIIDAITIEEDDDDAAIAAALRIDHAPFIEIWCGANMVTRVAPGDVDRSDDADRDDADRDAAADEDPV